MTERLSVKTYYDQTQLDADDDPYPSRNDLTMNLAYPAPSDAARCVGTSA